MLVLFLESGFSFVLFEETLLFLVDLLEVANVFAAEQSVLLEDDIDDVLSEVQKQQALFVGLFRLGD